MIGIYLTNLAMYNEGTLFGSWLTLPMNDDELELAALKIANRYSPDDEVDVSELLPFSKADELFITDYECDLDVDLRIGEFDDIHHLNLQADSLEGILEDYPEEVICAIIEECSSLDEAIEALESGDFTYYTDIYDEEDLGHAVADDLLEMTGVDSILSYYFDFERYGYDLTLSGYTIYPEYGVAICR